MSEPSNTAGHTIRPARGNIFMNEFIFPDGTEPGEIKERPCLVVSASRDATTSTVTIIPFTTKEHLPSPTHVIVTLSNGMTCTALCEYIKTVSKNSLGRYQGQIEKSYVTAINRALLAHLGLSVSRFATTTEVLAKAEFVLKAASFMEESEFPYLDTRKAVAGALEMVCDVDILKEPTELRIQHFKKEVKPEHTPISELPSVIPPAILIESSSEMSGDDELPSITEMPNEQPEMDLTPASNVESGQDANAHKTSQYLHEKLGLSNNEYLMADIAKLLDKKIDSIWRIVEKYNLKTDEYCRIVGSKYVYNDKAVDKIIECISARQAKKSWT